MKKESFFDIALEDYSECLKKSFDFSGRTRRSVFWRFQLVHTMTGFMFFMVGELIGDSSILYYYGSLMALANLSSGVRRVHDISLSGWYFLVGLIPFLSIILLIFFLTDSKGNNQYGPSPKRSV